MVRIQVGKTGQSKVQSPQKKFKNRKLIRNTLVASDKQQTRRVLSFSSGHNHFALSPEQNKEIIMLTISGKMHTV